MVSVYVITVTKFTSPIIPILPLIIDVRLEKKIKTKCLGIIICDYYIPVYGLLVWGIPLSNA